MAKSPTAIFDPKKPRPRTTKVTKTSKALSSRPTDILRSPLPPSHPSNGKKKVKKTPSDNWAVIVDEAEKWPYPDPDIALSRAETEIDDAVPLDRELPPDIIPYSEYEPWGRLERETDTQYKYFLQYRAQGFNRTLQAVATRFNVGVISIGEMAKNNEWHTRVVAWDLEREKVYTAEMLNGTREMARKHVRVAQKGIRALAAVFDEIDKRMEDPAFMRELGALPPKALLTLAQRSASVVPNLMQAERLARNLPTEITSIHVDHDIRSQSLDEIAEVVAAFITSVPRPEVLEGQVVEDEPRAIGSSADGADPQAQ